MNQAYDNYVSRARREHGERLDLSEIEATDPAFRAIFQNGQRVRVSSTDGWTRTGTVSVTTGWRPALLLMHRSSATGSWDVLSPRDHIVARWDGRRYQDVAS